MNLAHSSSSTDGDLEALVERFFRERFSTDNPIITEAVKRMLRAGGKRLRPRVTLLAAAACGGNPVDHLHLAAYMELIHVATLIHDDVVDNAQTRRGVNATAVDYGNRVSVLAGDYLFAWIFKNVTLNYPHPVPHVLSATLAEICDGEVLQLQALGNLDLPLETYVEIARKKTASLFAKPGPPPRSCTTSTTRSIPRSKSIPSSASPSSPNRAGPKKFAPPSSATPNTPASRAPPNSPKPSSPAMNSPDFSPHALS